MVSLKKKLPPPIPLHHHYREMEAGTFSCDRILTKDFHHFAHSPGKINRPWCRIKTKPTNQTNMHHQSMYVFIFISHKTHYNDPNMTGENVSPSQYSFRKKNNYKYIFQNLNILANTNASIYQLCGHAVTNFGTIKMKGKRRFVRSVVFSFWREWEEAKKGEEITLRKCGKSCSPLPPIRRTHQELRRESSPSPKPFSTLPQYLFFVCFGCK